MKTMPVQPKWLKAAFPRSGVKGVDREKKVVHGMVLAQVGPFKSTGRGEFDEDAIKEVVKLSGNRSQGLKSRFTHPTLSSDGLGKYLGRIRDVRMDMAYSELLGRNVAAARGDLYLADSAFKTPSGDLGSYVLDLAEEDPGALSSSLVLEADENYRLDAKGRPLEDKDGNVLPPLWTPTKLHASDIVDTGEAVDALLSAGVTLGELPDHVQRAAAEMLDQMFAGQPREVVESRCLAYLRSYLEFRYGAFVPAKTPCLDSFQKRIKAADLATLQMRR